MPQNDDNKSEKSKASQDENKLSVDKLISVQYSIKKELKTLRESYIRNAKEKRTKGVILGKKDSIKECWTQFCLNNRAIESCATEKEQKLPYFEDYIFDAVETFYSNFLGELNDALDKLLPSTSNDTNPDTVTIRSEDQNIPVSVEGVNNTSASQIKLPRIDIPKFSGNYINWRSFCDLFTTLIHDNVNIPNVQKLYFLKTSLEGEAARLIRHLDICSSNYEPAWDLLVQRFDNKRVIVNNYLKILTNQNCVKYESSDAIKKLLDTTNECIHSLRSLGIEIDTWDAMIIFLIVQKLPIETRDLWERSIGSSREVPTLKELLEFLETRFRTLEMLRATNSNTTQTDGYKPKKETRSFHVKKSPICVLCNRDHVLRQCSQFLRMDPQSRKNLVISKSLCLNCLAMSHPTHGCNNPKTCYHCKQRHHTLLHDETHMRERSIINLESGNNNTINSSLHASTNKFEPGITSLLLDRNQHSSNLLLATALIKVTSASGTHTLRALIDPGSQGSFITENTAQRLQLKRYNTSVKITGLGTSSVGVSSHQVIFRMESVFNNFACEVRAYVLKSLTGLHPSEPIKPLKYWTHVRGLKLADPTFCTPGRIDVLLGVDVYSQILTSGIRNGNKGSPIAQNSHLGWILFGDVHESAHHSTQMSTINVTNLHNCLQADELLKRFWELEEIQVDRVLTKEERECEEFYAATHCRLQDGRYLVKLPFFGFNPPALGESRSAALSRLYHMERKLIKTPEVYKEYSACMNEYLELSHMKSASTSAYDHVIKTPTGESLFTLSYLPHHAVFKDSTTTHLRVVFDASHRTTNGLSLNDTLLKGPKLQEDLVSIILRWRKHRIVFSADITKMYRQIRVAESDVSYQRIIWRDNPSQPIQEYDLATVTFGTACAPYLAIKTLRQLAHDEKDNYPLAAPVVLKDFYVDDVMSGADTEDAALEIQTQLKLMLSAGGFELRKWASNNNCLLESISEKEKEVGVALNLNEDGFIRALGVYWHPKNDSFFFKVSIREKQNVLTKRNLLSQIAQLFDPIGWLTPIIVTAKIMIQELWLAGITWDEPVNENIARRWLKLKNEFKILESIEIPRWIGTQHNTKTIQLHGFCDSSESAYCAVIYTRVVDEGNNIKINFLVSKSKVAPVRPVTLPRLELCGAALLAKLINKVKGSVAIKNLEIFAWCDSMITLAWIRGKPNNWKTFVSNRVAMIQEVVDCSSWRYVNTKDNPADCGSRGCLPSSLINNSSWWQGPQWLRLAESQWPTQKSKQYVDTHYEKKVKVHFAEIIQDILIENFSTLPRLLKITVLCFRFIRKIRCSKDKREDNMSEADEARHALYFWIKNAQVKTFSREISDLKAKQIVHHKSPILALTPFICNDGLVRVGGRLQQTNLNYNEKHPIILPTKHHLTHLIVKQAHLITLHGGPQLMAAYLRRTYWIPHSRNMIRQIVHQCMTCFRYKRSFSSQLMGNLPESRLKKSRAFLHTGVDYAGPISMRMSKVRGSKILKGYIAIFICLSTRAIHLEPVSDQTTQAFLAAFQRFTSRRGMCSDIYSDCGTNFVGASKVLRNEYEKSIDNTLRESTTKLAYENVRWHFNPPASPHFGGLWEAGVKSLKHHFKRVTGETSLTFEELATLLAQIEACLNSRPLCPMSNDPSDFSVLTPGHFLIGDMLLAPPESNILDMNVHTLTRWQYLQSLKQQIWKRWSREYISRLQERPKWTKQQKNFEIGNIVLIKDDRLPPTQWLLGRIEKIFPGQDGLVRVVTVRTKTGILKRPITKISLLPISDNNIDPIKKC